MGYLRPTAIIVTGSYGNYALDAHVKACEIFERYGLGEIVTELLPEAINSTRSFLVAWDGSKEGWDDSDRGDTARGEFVAWLREQAYEDGSSPLDWIEIQYGGDDREAIPMTHNGEVRTPLGTPSDGPT